MELDPKQARHGLTVMARTAQQSPAMEALLATFLAEHVDRLAAPAAAVAMEIGEPIKRVLFETLTTRPVSTDTLLALYSQDLPATYMLPVGKLLVERLPQEDQVETIQKSAILSKHAEVLWRVDRIGEALPTARRAVAHVRMLPDTFSDQRVLIHALNVLGWVQNIARDREGAEQTCAEAVARAERRAGALSDPYLGYAYLIQADCFRWTGRIRQALEGYRAAAQVWREIVDSPDPDPHLLLDRLFNRWDNRRDTEDSIGSGNTIHIAFGLPHPSTYEGPQFGDYRVNAILAYDGRFYINPRSWSPSDARLTLTRALLDHGRVLLVSGRPSEALPLLIDSLAVLDTLADSGSWNHLTERAIAEFSTAQCHNSLGQHEQSVAAYRRAITLLRTPSEGDFDSEWDLARDSCAFAAGFTVEDQGAWREFFGQLVALGQTVAATDDGRLLKTILGHLHETGVGLRNEGAEPNSVALLQLVINSSTDPEQQAMSLVGLANSHLRAGDAGQAAVAAAQAVAVTEAQSTPHPNMAVTSYHALSQALAANNRIHAALEAQQRAIEVLLARPIDDVIWAVKVLRQYVDMQRSMSPDQGIHLPYDVCASIIKLLERSSEFRGQRVNELSALGLAATSQYARDGELSLTRIAYQSLLDFTHRYGSFRATKIVRVAAAWNVTMCFIDSGAPDTAHVAVDDLAELLVEEPDNPDYLIEHAKCASEVIGAYWDTGQHEAARMVLRATERSLRSPHYLERRRHDLGEPPSSFLATLDFIKASAD